MTQKWSWTGEWISLNKLWFIQRITTQQENEQIADTSNNMNEHKIPYAQVKARLKAVCYMIPFIEHSGRDNYGTETR